MFFDNQVSNAVFADAQKARKNGEAKHNVYREGGESHEAYEAGWEATDAQCALFDTWLKTCKKAGESLKGQPMVFNTEFSDFKKYNGACEFDSVVVDGEGYDCESLPFYKIKVNDGCLIDADGEELNSPNGISLQSVIEVVSGSYGLAREQGFADPADLIFHGNSEQIAKFSIHVSFLSTIADAINL